jgi:hypothetical protein
MKKIMLSAAAAAALLSFAGTAQAAPGGQGINQQQVQLSRQIQQGEQRGVITRREANGLRRQLATVQRLEQRYRHGGLSRFERNDLDRRLDAVRASLRSERRDRDGRRG